MTATKAVIAAILSVLFAFTPTRSSAAPVNFDESVDGDLSFPNPWETRLFSLAFGTNRIAGGTTYSTTFIDEDAFGFLVPDGGKVVSISLSFSFPYAFYTTRAIALRDRTDLTGALIDAGSLLINPGNGEDTQSPAAFFLTSLPLMTSGTSFSIGMAGANWEAPGGTLFYEWRISVRPNAAPEPSMLVLLGVGVVTLAAWQRRRSKARTHRGRDR